MSCRFWAALAAGTAAGVAGFLLPALVLGTQPSLSLGLVHAAGYTAALALTPGIPFMLAGVLLFGPVWGAGFNLIGLAFGSTALAAVARYGLRNDLQHWRVTRHLTRIDPGARAALRWRFGMLPHVPLNIAVGLGTLRLRTFLAVNLVGFAPTVVIWALAGASLRPWAEGHPTQALAATLGITAATLGVNFALRRRRGRRDTGAGPVLP